MTEPEEKKEEIKEVKKEDRPSFLKEARAEREALEKVRDDVKGQIEELKDLKAQEIMSGKVEQGVPTEEKKKEETPQELLERRTGIRL